jgi:hypothetical protein
MSDRPDAYEADAQDSAEAMDETMLDENEELGDMRTFEELPELLDLTRADGDRDDDEAMAMDADEFDEDAVGDNDFEDDHELSYSSATAEHEDDLDGLGPEDDFDEDALRPNDIDGLEEVRDGGEAQGGEDDVTDFQARGLSDRDLQEMGYSEDRFGVTRAKPNPS